MNVKLFLNFQNYFTNIFDIVVKYTYILKIDYFKFRLLILHY